MNLLVVSDLHLSGESERRNEQFVSFLVTACEERDSVVIAGDLFEVWLGWPKFTFPYQERILGVMRERRAEGLRIEYVEGNRDFRIKRYEGELFDRVSQDGVWLEWGKRRIYVEHGDMVNKSDRQYRFWRGVSKNAISLGVLGILPARGVLRVSQQVERRMRSTNIAYKSIYPEAWTRSLCRERFSEGANVVVLGHFHEEREERLSIGDGELLFYNLPGWELGFRYLVIPDTAGEPYFTMQE